MDIVMIGYAGRSGACALARAHRKRLLEDLPADLLSDAEKEMFFRRIPAALIGTTSPGRVRALHLENSVRYLEGIQKQSAFP